ncbi:MAG: antibiotic biosynthesis monooxygenase [Dechloromonas sp.]|nr:MAG: antibiotic biosynthesis monooxygenase [Dechloromonas sp.]
MSEQSVFRIVSRRARPACEAAYEALVKAMFDEARRFPGYLSAELIPPPRPGGEYQIVQRFATQADLDRWNASPERLDWMEKLSTVADGAPEYRLLHGLDAWFAPTSLPVAKTPPRWRLTLVSWLGIYPTVAVLLIFVGPLLEGLPQLLRIAVITALVAVLMSYVIMPRLTRWLGAWLRR